MNTRIRELRKDHLKMTQQAFADSLGLSQNFIWQLEKGEREPSDRTISDICRIFNVDRVWLETGDGEPFLQQSRNEIIAKSLGDAIKSNNTAKNRLIRALCQLPDELFPYAERIVQEICENLKKEAE